MNFQPTLVNPQGLTALIRNLGRDCSPSQYLREFLMNAIEACQRTQKKQSHITIDLNPEVFEAKGFYKISFTDNGDGMSLDEMLLLLNNLSSSGSQTNQYQNYGVGAKVSAMTRNHEGIQYESWKDGKGYKVVIGYQKESDIYGVQGFTNDKGEIMYAEPLTNKHKPKIIDQHGTRATLFGMFESQDTMATPRGLPFDSEGWIATYLNHRFFKLPTNIMIKVRQGYLNPKKDTEKNYLKSILGFQAIANKEAEAHGMTRLSNANAYWWILPENSELKGHTAFLNQDEIFDVSDARSNRLTHFGIMVARDRVIIYIEPDDTEQNTARSHLVKKDGSNVDWSVYEDEFRNHQPDEILQLMDRILTETSQASNKKEISNRLRSIQALFLLSGFKPLGMKQKAKSDALASKTKDTQTESSNGAVSLQGADSNPNPDPKTNIAEESFLAELDVNLFPRVEWTNELRSPQLAGRAAEYIEVSNLVLANRDFKGFKDLIQFFLDKYAGTENLDNFVVGLVNEVVEQALMECVAGALSLRDQPHWNPHQSHLSLTPEAITIALMQRYWMASYVDQKIRKELLRSL